MARKKSLKKELPKDPPPTSGPPSFSSSLLVSGDGERSLSENEVIQEAMEVANANNVAITGGDDYVDYGEEIGSDASASYGSDDGSDGHGYAQGNGNSGIDDKDECDVKVSLKYFNKSDIKNNENENDGVGDSDGGDDGSDSSMNDANDARNLAAPTPPSISKSWASLTAHYPCYTGGTVFFSHDFSDRNTSTSRPDTTNSTNTESDGQKKHFILAQRGGDIAIIESSTGHLLRTVRKGTSNLAGKDLGSSDYDGSEGGYGCAEDGDFEEDDEEILDAEAITAFSLSPNNSDLIAVTRNHLVRRYNLTNLSISSKPSTSASKIDESNNKHDKAGEKINQKQAHETNGPAKMVYTFGKSGHTLPVTSVSFHPSGIFFATGSVDGLVKVWDVKNGYATHAFYPTSGESSQHGMGERGRYAVTSLEWRPTKTSLILAIGREDGSVAIHDLLLYSNSYDEANGDNTKKASLPVAVMRDHVSAVTCVAWSEVAIGKVGCTGGNKRHGGGLFFSSGRDSVINTWVISEEEVAIPKKSKRRKKQEKGASDTFTSTKIKVTYTRIRTLPVYEQVESMLLLSSTSRFLSTIRPFATTKSQQRVLDKQDVLLATCGNRGIVRLWKASPTKDKASNSPLVLSDLSLLASQKENDAFGENNGGYTSLHLTVSPGGSHGHWGPRLAAVDAEHNITYLRVEWGTSDADENSGGDDSIQLVTERSIVGHNGEILDLVVVPPQKNNDRKENNDRQYSRHDRHRLAVATNSSRIRLFGLNDKVTEESISSNMPSMHAALSPRGFLGTNNGNYNSSGTNSNAGHSAIVLSLSPSPCGRYLASCSKDKTALVWHLSSQICVALALGHTEAVGGVCLSRKIGAYDVGGKAADSGAGAFMMTVSKDRTLKLWPLPGSGVLDRTARGVKGGDGKGEGEMLSLKSKMSVRAHEKDINIVSIAPNDSLIATGSQDKTIKLWRNSDLSLHGTLKGHKRGVWDAQFSPHDRVIATASGDRTVKLWSLGDCTCVRTFQGHMAGVLRVRFLVTGLQLLSSGSDGLIKLWTVRTNECETTIDSHNDKAWALDLSPCGTALFSGGADSKIAVWWDTTIEKEMTAREEEEKNISMAQNLSNCLRHKRYEEALEIALELDKPSQALRVLAEIIEKDATKNNEPIETLQKHAANWSIDRITKILNYCREWNTRARNSQIAMLVVKAVVTTIPVTKLASYDGIPEILTGIAPYAERHFNRLDGIVESTYLLDYSLVSAGSLHGTNNGRYEEWLSRSRYALPPKVIDGKVQVDGAIVVGERREETDSSEDELVTIGDSDSD